MERLTGLRRRLHSARHRSTASARRRGLTWSAAAVLVLVAGMSVTESTAARWAGEATTSGSTISAGSVAASIGGFSGLTHRFGAGGMTDTGAFTITSVGTQTMTWTASIAVVPGGTTALHDALTATVWQASGPSACTATATAGAGWSGRWSAVPTFSSTLAPGASITYCMRTTAARAALSITGAFSTTATVVASLAGTNWSTTSTATATFDSVALSPAYTSAVVADNPTYYWPMNETAGTAVYDVAGTNDALAAAGVTRNAPGVLLGSSAPSSSFSGDSTGSVIAQTSVAGPNTFTLEAWFKTTDANGGKIIGFGNSKTGLSSKYDRHLYLDAAGRLLFGVYSGATRTITTVSPYNDGVWHLATATLSSVGMALYVDGAPVATDPNYTTAESGSGYWHIGMDTSWSGDTALSGSIDEVAVYSTALSSSKILWHYAVATGKPFSSFTAAPSGVTAAFDASTSVDTDGTIASYAWSFGDGTTGVGVSPSHIYPVGTATYPVTLTVTDNSGGTAAWTSKVSIVDPTATTSPGSPTFTGTTQSSTTIAWTAPSAGPAMVSYNLYRDGSLLAQVPGTSYTDTGLGMNTAYSYVVRGVDGTGALTTPSPTRSVTTLSFDGTTFYQVRNARSGLCIRVPATADGTKLEQTACAAAQNQNFQLVATTGGYHQVAIRTQSTSSWDVTDKSIASGALIQLWTYSANTNQQWLLTRQGDGSYQFANRQSGMCLDVVGGSIVDGAKIQQSTCSATSTSQLFTLVAAP